MLMEILLCGVIRVASSRLKLLINRALLFLGVLITWLAIAFRTELVELVNPSKPAEQNQQEQQATSSDPKTITDGVGDE